MQPLNKWKICRSCARQYGLSMRTRPSGIRQARQLSLFSQTLRESDSSPGSAEKAKDRVEVNYYEKFAHGKKGIRRISQDEFEGQATVQEIKEHIQKLEAQLHELESSKEVTDISEADRAILENVMAAQDDTISGKDIRGLLDGSEDDPEMRELADQLDLEFHLPSAHQRNLGKLGTLFQNVSNDPSNTRLSRSLWQQYTLCKDQLPGIEEQLPDEAWDLLWQSQYEIDVPDDSRSRHLWTLVEDIAKHKQKLSPIQILVRIEGMVAERKYQEGFKIWELERQALENNEEVAEPFRDLGPHILALMKRPRDAQILALDLSQNNPRINTFIPVFEAWLQDGNKNSVKRAWALYIRFRELMGEHMTLEIYDRLVMIFLKGGQKDIALAIFKDLVLSGRNSEFDSMEIKNKSLGVLKILNEESHDAYTLNQLSLASMTFLPRRFQNKYFYAMWLKRLIGMGEIEAATTVIELMYLRGVRADPRHINGLIGALFRRGNPYDKETAVNLGWSMINERLKFVAERNSQHSGLGSGSGSESVPTVEDPSIRLPPYLGKNLPSATVETFALLVLHYTRTSMRSSVERLNTALTAAELTPNIYYINHLLYGRLRAHDQPGLWNLFLHATTSYGALQPDMSTFRCLWDAENAHVTTNPATRRDRALRAQNQFPGPRSLYRHMMNWLSSLPEKARERAKDEFVEDHALCTQILRCFCLSLDLPGALIALYSLKNTFGVYPNEEDIRLLCIQLARSSEPPRGGWKTRRVGRFSDRKESQERLGKIGELLQILEHERTEALEGIGIKQHDLSKHDVAEEGLWLAGALVRSVMEAKQQETLEALNPGSNAGGQWARNDVEKIAWEMGAGPFTIGAPIYEQEDGRVELVGFEGQDIGLPHGEENLDQESSTA